MQYAVDIFEQNRLWDWTPPVKRGICPSCSREADLHGSQNNIGCGACFTLSRCYDNRERPSIRLQAQVIFAGAGRSIVWMNPNPSATFGRAVDVRHPVEGRCYLQDALEFIIDQRNRQKPYIFAMFHLQSTMSISDLVLNIDPDFLFISANRGRPHHAATQFRSAIDLRQAEALLERGIDFGKGHPRDRVRLIEEGFAEEELNSSHWRLAQIISTGRPMKWF